jgi:hypothetical protein
MSKECYGKGYDFGSIYHWDDYIFDWFGVQTVINNSNCTDHIESFRQGYKASRRTLPYNLKHPSERMWWIKD